MSVVRGFGLNGKSLYTNVAKPQYIHLTFTVDSTVGSGVRSVKSNGYVDSVYMHTSTTPTEGSPNPATGYAVIRFTNNFNYYLNTLASEVKPTTSNTTTHVLPHNTYVITAVGDTDEADTWTELGLPAGFTPAVGASFIGLTDGYTPTDGYVGLPAAQNIDAVSVVGQPQATISNSAVGENGGASIVLQFAAGGVVTNPTDGAVVSILFMYDGSSVTIDGL